MMLYNHVLLERLKQFNVELRLNSKVKQFE